MNEQDLQALSAKVDEIYDAQQNVSQSLAALLNQVSDMEKRFDEHFGLSHVLAELRAKLESVDVDGMFAFLTDIEAEIESLSYNYKRAEKANGISVYKIVNSQMPMYFKPKI